MEDERFGILIEQVRQLSVKMDKLEATVDRLEDKAAKWQGGFLLIMGLGGLITWVINVSDKVRLPH